MFTGLIACVGEITNVSLLGHDKRFTISTPRFENLMVGESVAVNGACLTVESFEKNTFCAFASAETLSITTLGTIARGHSVNLERALAFGERIGGHLVSGHVDAVAEIETIEKRGNSFFIRVSFPEKFSSQVILKGSVALDGISLTVNACEKNSLEVNIIPESQSSTTISQWTAGKKINFETDIIGKYVQKMLFPDETSHTRESSSTITVEFLRENGF